MTWNRQPNFRDHVRAKLVENSYFMVILSWHAVKHFKTVRKWGGIFQWGLLHVITRNIGQMMHEARFTKLHSQKKEKQLSNVLKGWIFVILLVLKLLSIVREPWTILEWGFLHIVTKSMDKMKYTAKFIYLHSSQKEMQLSTVRFFWDWVYKGQRSRVNLYNWAWKNRIKNICNS